MKTFSRRALLATLALPLLVPSVAQAQTVNLTGHWRGYYMGVVIDLVVTPVGDYVNTQYMSGVMTMQSGRVRQVGPGVIHLDVVDWQPRTRNVYHATGTVGGYYTQEPIAQPPGGMWRVVFHSATSITMTDLGMGGSIELQRIE